MATLNKKIETLENQLKDVKAKNKTDENKLREDSKKADNLYKDNFSGYDNDMRDRTRQKETMQQEYD